jgi:alpha-amylase
MTRFVLCIHNHQPVGNFDHVIEEAYQNSYWPFLESIARHPAIKLSLHNTGFLLDWIAEKHPEYIELLAGMVKRGQVEVVGGGYYEPVLSVIPEEDRLKQVTMLSDRIEELFGKRPRGIWLAERVWEPTHPSIIKKAGLEYLVVDDYHFLKVGLRKDQLGGYYTTEDQGNLIKIFPGNEALRYIIPFKSVEEFEGYMRSIDNGFFTRGSAAIYGDDGEKFGVWPGTHKLVFHDGWLERFFAMIEKNLDWIQPSTLGEFLDHEEPVGHTYLPNTSYMEMGEWSLPADASREYMDLMEEVSKWGEHGDKVKRFLQGGTWRNFLAKYPEANWLHKRMLMVSAEVKKRRHTKSDGLQEKAERLLYQAQCNDAYWHGVFGGLYLPHLRTKVYENLILAEKIAVPGSELPEVFSSDIDADYHEETVMRTAEVSLFLSPFNGGSLFEFDYRPRGVNLSNTLTRWPEGYHYKLERHARGGHDDSGAKSIHDVIKVKEEGLEKYLKYDSKRRTSLVDHFFPADFTLDSFYSGAYAEEGSFAHQRYQREVTGGNLILSRKAQAFGKDVSVRKEIVFETPNTFKIDYHVKSLLGSFDARGFFGVEMNFLLPCCDGPVCKYVGKPSFEDKGGLGLGSTGEVDGLTELTLVDSYTGVKVRIELDTPATLWRYPVHTVSLSEGGFEKIFQGSCLLFLFNAEFFRKGGFRASFRITADSLSQ